MCLALKLGALLTGFALPLILLAALFLLISIAAARELGEQIALGEFQNWFGR
jgi:hypothetical protein